MPTNLFLEAVLLTVLATSLAGLAIFSVIQSISQARREALDRLAMEREALRASLLAVRSGIDSLLPDAFVLSVQLRSADAEEELVVVLERFMRQLRDFERQFAEIPNSKLIGGFAADEAQLSVLALRLQADGLWEEVELCRRRVDDKKRRNVLRH